ERNQAYERRENVQYRVGRAPARPFFGGKRFHPSSNADRDGICSIKGYSGTLRKGEYWRFAGRIGRIIGALGQNTALSGPTGPKEQDADAAGPHLRAPRRCVPASACAAASRALYSIARGQLV